MCIGSVPKEPWWDREQWLLSPEEWEPLMGCQHLQTLLCASAARVMGSRGLSWPRSQEAAL